MDLILSICIIGLTFLATIMSTYCDMKQGNQLTRPGKFLIAILVLSCLIAVYQLIEQGAKEKRSKYLLKDSDFTFELEASILGSEREKFLAASPESLVIRLSDPDTSTSLEFVLEPYDGFLYSGYSRGTTTNTRIYTSKSVKFSSKSVKYLWDLNNVTLTQSRSPKYAFNDVTRDNGVVADWQVKGTLKVMGKEFKQSDDKGIALKFSLQDLSKSTLD